MIPSGGACAFDAVVVHSISRLSRSIRDRDQTVETIVEESDTELQIVFSGFGTVSDSSAHVMASRQTSLNEKQRASFRTVLGEP